MHWNFNVGSCLKTIIKWFPSLPLSDMKGLCRLTNLLEQTNTAAVPLHSHTQHVTQNTSFSFSHNIVAVIFTPLIYTAWRWLFYVAETCSCYHSHCNIFVPWLVVFLSLCYDCHCTNSQHIPTTYIFCGIYSKCFQVVMVKSYVCYVR
jgi:hypothetical protein